MAAIEKAIEEFQAKQAKVYSVDPGRLGRDARAADRAAKDHTGRWFFELFQNCDDAQATEVLVLVSPQAIYVADNGRGLTASAVESICGTDFSDKTAGTIGRKGVGFKAVYELTQNPQILTVNGEGLEFSPEKTRDWLAQKGFDEGALPYQWVPFFLSRPDAEREDPTLARLSRYKTVVKVPLASPDMKKKAEKHLDWPTHALLPFQNVRTLEVQLTAGGKAPLKLAVRHRRKTWEIEDSRLENNPVHWRVAKHCEYSPESLLGNLSQDEQERIKKDGVRFLVAAPLDDNQLVLPTEGYLPVHVFYPTEQESPLRLLLHAEFLVKSDRTALLPIEESEFNQWVADRLADHVCAFVQNAYLEEDPSNNLALLLPFEDRETHPVAASLWDRIARAARQRLRLGNVDGKPWLSVADAKMVSVSVEPDCARRLLEGTPLREHLLHRAFDEDTEARKALAALGCRGLQDEDVMRIIEHESAFKRGDHEWVWICWKWLAAWVAGEPYGEKLRERVDRVRGLPIIPVAGWLRQAADLNGRIVTWRADNHEQSLPKWLPLTFVADWFRDRLQAEPEGGEVFVVVIPATDRFRDRLQAEPEGESDIKNLCKEMGIKEPGPDVVQRAVGRAIKHHWRDKRGPPGRFLSYLFEQDWHETSRAPSALCRCPVPVVLADAREKTWSEARHAYFGRGWANDLLADLYEGSDSVAWVQRIGKESEKERKVLAWLGCSDIPRIIEERGARGVNELPEECGAWRTQALGDTNWRTSTVDTISRLDRLAVKELSDRQVYALLVLLAEHWAGYYQGHAQTTLSWFYCRTRSRSVPAFWWYGILRELRPPTKTPSPSCALVDCWLPNKRTERAIGDLLIVIDLEAFGEDKERVRDWLTNTVPLRTRVEQLTVQEWTELLCDRIPQLAPLDRVGSDDRLKDKVAGWYEACLDASADRDDVPEKAFTTCPLLCRKADVWDYVAEEPRYLVDDHEFDRAFNQYVWMLDIKSERRGAAEKYFGIPSLSRAVQVEIDPGKPARSLEDDLKTCFAKTLPYVFAWRSAQTKEDTERLRARLTSLKVEVVPVLTARVALGTTSMTIERRFAVCEGDLFLREDHVNEATLAQALADALGVKSEADFYENLLRCKDDAQRKEKLLAKGIPEAQVDRCLRDYSGQPPAEVKPAKEQPEEQPETPSRTGAEPSCAGAPAISEERRVATSSPGEPGPHGTAPSPEKPEPLRLKDSAAADYVVGVGKSGFAGGGTGGVGAEGGSAYQQHRVLSEDEKTKIEKCGRQFAQRELEASGYSVEQMPLENPGFDLRALKGEEELRVEAKAHLVRATVVDVTHREYKEYLGSKRVGAGEYRWELWNVEHLEQDEQGPVTVTKYAEIPDEALDVRSFRVDLKKCSART